MNQILVINNYKYSNYKKIYLCLFSISISISLILLFHLFYSYFIKLNETKKTYIIKNKYNISTLYDSSPNYTTLNLSNNISIIGLIEIPKINISYPIIENTNEDLLKISVCKFSGPFPNRIGNLCIAGHNYKNKFMFSNLYKLNIGDSFYITDLNNTKIEYVIYKKFIAKENNLECMQNTNTVEVTLITCNNTNNKERIIIKSKMKG